MRIMKKYAKIFGLMIAALCIASMVFSACRKEMPPVPELPPPPPDTTYDGYNDDDTTGIEIKDSIIVMFGNERWSTLDYESHIEEDSVGTHQEWIFIDAHYPGKTYPMVSIKILKAEGNHTGHMNPTIVSTMVDPFTPPVQLSMPVPSLAGDMNCGSLYYFSSDSAAHALHMTDGLMLGDWWPWDLTTSVLQCTYNMEGQLLLTGRCLATMFNYLTWISNQQAGTPINVEDAEVKDFKVSFGALKINR